MYCIEWDTGTGVRKRGKEQSDSAAEARRLGDDGDPRTRLEMKIGGTRRAELGGGWSTQSFSEIFEICGLLSSLLKYLSQGKMLRLALAEMSKSHRDVLLPSGWSGPLCMLLAALPWEEAARHGDAARRHYESARRHRTRLQCRHGSDLSAGGKGCNKKRIGRRSKEWGLRLATWYD